MKTFKGFFCALRFIYSFEELLDFLRTPRPKNKTRLNSRCLRASNHAPGQHTYGQPIQDTCKNLDVAALSS